MLNRRNLIIVVVVLVALVAVSVLQRNQHRSATNQASSQALIDGEWTRDQLGGLVVGYADDPAVVELTASEDGWRVASSWDAGADHDKIDSLLRTLSGLRGEFRSDSPEVLADYGFTDSTTVRLSGRGPDGTEAFAIEVGDKPSSGRGNFVRRPGSSEVFLSTADVLGSLGLWSGPERPQGRHFLDLVAYRGDRNAVHALRLDGDQTVALTKEYAMVDPAPADTVEAEPTPDHTQWEWRLGDGTMAQKTRADGVLSAVVTLRAQDVADPTVDLAEYGLDPAARTVTIELRDGDPVEIRLGDERPAADENPGGYYAQVVGDPTVWVVGTFNADNMFKTRADLVPE